MELEQINFEQHGFQNRIYVPELDFNLELKPHQYFRNDGIVGNIFAHLYKIEEELDCERSEDPSPFTKGLHINPHDPDEQPYSIIFAQNTNPLDNLVTLGHETTHVLIYFDLEEYLVGLLEDYNFDSRKYLKIEDEEVRADIGGFLFAYIKGKHYRLPALINYVLNTQDSFKRQ